MSRCRERHARALALRRACETRAARGRPHNLGLLAQMRGLREARRRTQRPYAQSTEGPRRGRRDESLQPRRTALTAVAPTEFPPCRRGGNGRCGRRLPTHCGGSASSSYAGGIIRRRAPHFERRSASSSARVRRRTRLRFKPNWRRRSALPGSCRRRSTSSVGHRNEQIDGRPRAVDEASPRRADSPCSHAFAQVNRSMSAPSFVTLGGGRRVGRRSPAGSGRTFSSGGLCACTGCLGLLLRSSSGGNRGSAA